MGKFGYLSATQSLKTFEQEYTSHWLEMSKLDCTMMTKLRMDNPPNCKRFYGRFFTCLSFLYTSHFNTLYGQSSVDVRESQRF